MHEIVAASTDAEIATARELISEYINSLSFLPSREGWDEELARLPGDYAQPMGRILIAFSQGGAAGCVCLRNLGGGICEMKRLYVRPQFRKSGLGRVLAQKIIAEARAIGYRIMRLDTIAGRMPEAIALYRSLGFREIPAYHSDHGVHTVFMEMEL